MSQLNQQSPTVPDRRLDGWLHVHHIFHTIQGEGPFAGWPAIFIRLFGCNLQCPACDTDYSSRDDLLQPDNILALVNLNAKHFSNPSPDWKPIVVITGGEPFRQNLIPLLRVLANNGYLAQIETNGTLHLEGIGGTNCHIICSPKTPRINELMAKRANAFKYVLQAGHVAEDGLPTDTMLNPGHAVARPPLGSTTPIYVQPLDETLLHKGSGITFSPEVIREANDGNLQAAVASCMKFGYRLSVQTHKLANLE